MFDPVQLIEPLEVGMAAEGEFFQAVIVTTVKTAQPDDSELGFKTTSAVVEYRRIVLKPCGHIGCGNPIGFNLN